MLIALIPRVYPGLGASALSGRAACGFLMALGASVLNVLDKSHKENLNKLCFKSAAKIRNISFLCKFLGNFFCGFKGKM